MTIRKTLTRIVLTAALALSGCTGSKELTLNRFGRTENDMYNIDDAKLEDGVVTFSRASGQEFHDYTNRLTVIREGRLITYIDRGDDLLVDEVRIYDRGRITYVGEKQALGEAQQQFNDYLQRILEYKRKLIDPMK